MASTNNNAKIVSEDAWDEFVAWRERQHQPKKEENLEPAEKHGKCSFHPTCIAFNTALIFD